MVRTKRLERSPKTINIDNDIREWLDKKYPNLASDVINECLRERMAKDKGKVESLIGSDTSAGRIAYTQALEKLGYQSTVSWKALSQDEQLKFIKIYKERLVDLQARGL